MRVKCFVYSCTNNINKECNLDTEIILHEIRTKESMTNDNGIMLPSLFKINMLCNSYKHITYLYKEEK